METNTMRLQLAKNSVAVYGVESALFLTAGIMDIYEDTNVEVETAMLKVFPFLTRNIRGNRNESLIK